MTRRFSRRKIKLIREAVKSGKSYLQVAKEFKTGFHTVYKYASDVGILNPRKIRPEIIEKIRKEVKRGESRYLVARKYGVSPNFVYYKTEDLPKNDNLIPKPIPVEKKQKIRELVKSGLLRRLAAEQTGVSYGSVLRITRDLPAQTRGNRSLGYSTLLMLQKLIKDGFIIPEKGQFDNTQYTFHMLQRRFPARMVFFKRTKIYFLEDRKEEALKAFIKHTGRYIRYTDYKRMVHIFGLSPNLKKKEEIVGEIKKSVAKANEKRSLNKYHLGRFRDHYKKNVGSSLLNDVLSHGMDYLFSKELIGLNFELCYER